MLGRWGLNAVTRQTSCLHTQMLRVWGQGSLRKLRLQIYWHMESYCRGGGLVSGCLSWMKRSDLTDSEFVSLEFQPVKRIPSAKVINVFQLKTSVESTGRFYLFLLPGFCFQLLAFKSISTFSKRSLSACGDVAGCFPHQRFLFSVLGAAQPCFLQI